MQMVLVGSMVWSLVAGAAGAASPVTSTAASTAAPDPCAGALDAVNDGARQCRSPGAAELAPLVVADDKAAVETPLRDPLLFPSELGFLAVLTAVAGGGAVAGAVFTEGTVADQTGETLRQGTLWGGVGMLSLSGAIAAAAVGTWVFDVSTGSLRLPIFAGEPQ
jgi:hypothetical protein